MSITVAGPVPCGGTITVFAHGQPVKLEVHAGESARSVARQLAAALSVPGLSIEATT